VYESLQDGILEALALSVRPARPFEFKDQQSLPLEGRNIIAESKRFRRRAGCEKFRKSFVDFDHPPILPSLTVRLSHPEVPHKPEHPAAINVRTFS
jgi:hypothetical protein